MNRWNEAAPIVTDPEALKPPEAMLLDLDGTLYRGHEPVPGAAELIAWLEEEGVPCWYVTNNSSRTPAQVAEQLRGMGIRAEPRQVVTSAEAAAAYAKEQYPGAAAFVIGERGLIEAMREAGFAAADGDPQRADLVVQGIDRSLAYERVAEATRHLMAGAAYLLTNPDRQLPVAGGIQPGAGSIAAMLETASGVRPTVVGKPSPILMNFALARAGVSAENAWVVGDNPLTDIAAGRAVGSPTVLVLTGLCSEDDWRARCEAAGAMPDAVCRGPAELTALVERTLRP